MAQTTLERTHPAYADHSNLQKHLKNIQRYKDKGAIKMMETYINFAQKSIEKLKANHPDVDISAEIAQYEAYKKGYDEQVNGQNAQKQSEQGEVEYFKKWERSLSGAYHIKTADQADLLKANGRFALQAYEAAKDFDEKEYRARLEQCKQNGTYTQVQFFSDRFLRMYDDYDNFIERSEDTFYSYLKDLTYAGVKGNPQEEMKQLKEAEALCKTFLAYRPNNTTAKGWLAQVHSRMGNKSKTMESAFASELHKKYVGQVVFSKKPLQVGSENESDLTNSFVSGDHIYGTLYLANTVRIAQDSYALLYMDIYVDGDFLATTNETGIWVTTPMQEKTYLQFALSPDQSWIDKNYAPYVENEQYTLGQFNEFLASKGDYPHKVKIVLRPRGTAVGKITGEFRIDLSGGSDFYQKLGAKLKGETIANVGVPKAGMRDASLEAQMLKIVSGLNPSNRIAYQKAIITTPNWTVERNSLTGVILGRTIQGVVTGKKPGGTCFFQYFSFKQAYTGSGYSSALSYAGAGPVTVITCDKIH
ncbi:MAG: hypothetical protein AAF740_00040 [Bacteroidota bacterium]